MTSTAIPQTLPFRITPREWEVLLLIVEGKMNKEIALDLLIGPQTVKNHIRTLFLKTGCASRAKIIIWYFQVYLPSIYLQPNSP